MKRVWAYKDSRGALHLTKEAAATAEMQALTAEKDTPLSGMSPRHASLLVHNRAKVISVLQAVDCQEAAPERATVGRDGE